MNKIAGSELRKMPQVRLERLPERAFADWKAQGIKGYAADKRKSHGYSAEDALKLSTDSFARSLPQGLATPDNHIFQVLNGQDQVVGSVWFAVQEDYGLRRAFIYDIVIVERERRKGYGRATMAALEGEVRKLGIKTLGLHVFAFNKAAEQLYRWLGYQVTDLTMEKKL
ncbi:GNAT family N-acetyltransferase [Kiloniella laminariae]|uniref:GNAT family N-acetyltransferase n=1 Tax=Kiloniella laminariae TaxID=454162 RepID=A0ABT4LFJ7_9PROT|nr:GNAT family N-acetyltransferase [Kiloniella laminariae]MCZ4279868.1 GNAT family N-acetyltransferase [Kiloniella laminariae]